MRIRFDWLLPTVQLPLAIALLYWSRNFDTKGRLYDTLYASTPALLCGGINAPARFFTVFSHFFYRVDRAAPTIFGFDLDYVLFLMGIVVLWTIIGRLVDKRRASAVESRRWDLAKFLWFGVPLIAMGLLLLYMGVHGLMNPWQWNNRFGNILESTLIVGWSCVLLYPPATQVRRYLLSNREM